MALNLGTNTSDRVDCGNGASITDLTTFSILMWVRPTTQTGSRRFWCKGAGANERSASWRSADTNDVSFFVPRATTAGEARTAMDYGTGSWLFFAFTYSEGNGPKVYSGTLTTAAVEATYVGGYPVVGSGATKIDNDFQLIIGNRTVASPVVAFQGDIATFMEWNRELTLGEIKQQQFRLMFTSGTVLFLELGWNGTGTQYDWSGNGNSGTVTGATVSNHVPISPPFGFGVWGEVSRQQSLAMLGCGV